MSRIQLMVGLGNPGPEYQATRHNAGAWCVERFAASQSANFQENARFKGHVAQGLWRGETLRYLLPTTYMNLSGQSVAACAGFYKIPPEDILVVHDELDLAAGIARFKQGGGAGGHNGVRSVMTSLGSDAFSRLRIGIGHPGDRQEVLGHVLKKASPDDQSLIEQAIEDALDALPLALDGQWQQAMTRLHSKKPDNQTGNAGNGI